MLSGLSSDLEFFTTLLEAMPDRVIGIDLASRIVYLNQAAKELFHRTLGLPGEGLVGRFVGDLSVTPSFWIDMEARTARVAAGQTERFEMLVPLPAGARWLEFDLFPLRRKDGALAGIAMISRDIQERKSAELRLQLLAKISSLAEMPSYDDLLAAVARLSIPELADACVVDIIESGLLRRRVAVAHSDPEKQAILARLPQLSADEAPPRRGTRSDALRAGQTLLIEDFSTENLYDHGLIREEMDAMRKLKVRSALLVPQMVQKTLMSVTIFMGTEDSGRRYDPQDIALAEDLARRVGYILEIKRSQEALSEELLFRERMMGILGHDLRNPLSAVCGLTGLLLVDQTLPEPLRPLAAHLDRAGHRMVEMINTLLDFTQSRFQGSLPIVPAPTDLYEVCQGVLAELRAAHPGRAIESSQDGDGAGEWDAARMAQVVSNLVGNALQHGERGTSVRVSMTGEGDELLLKVTNRGPVIPAALRAEIFKPFRQGLVTAEGKSHRGLGLGLYISQQIVSAHGGHITVESSVEAGTTFTVRMARWRGRAGDEAGRQERDGR